MFNKILVAYNESQESRAALQACIRLGAGPDTEVHLLGIMNIGTYLMAGEHVCEAMLAAEKGKIDSEVNANHAILAAAGMNVIDHVCAGEPAAVIIDLVEKLDIELLIIGHARSKPLAQRWWRGSTDTLLVEKIRCNVLIAADAA